MISKLYALTAACILASFTTLTAQVSSYTFSQSIGSYGASGAGTIINTPLTFDEVIATNLPFTFTFNSNSYSSISVCGNGFMSFSNITGSEYQPLSDLTTQDMISAFGTFLLPGSQISGDITAGSNTITNCSSVAGYSVGDVLMDVNLDFGGVDPIITSIVGNTIVVNQAAVVSAAATDIVAQADIYQSVSGVAPNRVCQFEYKHFSRVDANFDILYDDVITFKVKLYETTNRIEFVYALVSGVGQAAVSEVGLKGASNQDFNSRTVTSPNAWSTSNAAALITDGCELSNTLAPAIGQTYAWNPLTCTTPTLSVVHNPNFTCPGASATLTASGATSYTWVNGPNTSQYVVSPLATTNYTLIGANEACTSSLVVTHSTIPAPILTVTQSANQQCAGTTITLTAAGATTFTWVNGPASSQYIVSPSVTTVYTLTGSNGGACNGITLVTQSVIPYPVLGLSQQNTTICDGETAVLTATGATSYSWSSGQTSAQISVTPSATTNYLLSGNNAQCSSTLNITLVVDLCLGVKETDLANNIYLFPNPITDQLSITNHWVSDISVVISDALGKVVNSVTLNNSNSQTIETSFLSRGIYFISVSDNKTTVTKKIVKN